MPIRTEISNEEQELWNLLIELRDLVQSYKNSAAVERNKFDKSFNEKRSREIHQKQDINFDAQFILYNYHAQSIKRCRDKLAQIDEQLVPMLDSYNNPFFYLLEKDSNLHAHCDTTRKLARDIIFHLDAITKDNSLFQVYEVYDLLRKLFTRFDNWFFVLDKSIKDLEQAYNDILGQE